MGDHEGDRRDWRVLLRLSVRLRDLIRTRTEPVWSKIPARWRARVARIWRPAEPLKPIRASRHPYQIWLVVAAGLSGWSTIAKGVSPGSLQQNLPHQSVYLWAGLLLVGGGLCMFGAIWKDEITALLVERIGQFAIAGAEVVYAIVLWKTFGDTQGLQGPALNAGLAVAAVWRIRHCNRDLNRLERTLHPSWPD